MAKKYFENFRLDLAYNHFFKYLEKENGMPILEALEISSGENLPKSKMNSGPFPVYGGGGKTSETHSDFNFEFGTLGIGRVGARCGCVFEIVPNSWVTDNALVVIKWDQRFSLRFLKHYLAYLDLGQYANNAMQPVISKTRISHIQLPIISISEQEEIARSLDKIEHRIKISEEENLELSSALKVIDHWAKLTSEIQSQKSLLSQLKQSILQEAIQGKLTEEWRALRQAQQAPLESASELLKRIQAEKARLIKEKKIKKEKSLPPITDSEKPFELPEGWEWCRLGEIVEDVSYGTSQKSVETNVGVPVLRMGNITIDGKVLYSNLKYVQESIKDLPKLYLKKRDLIFNRTNSFELVGKSGVFENIEPYTLASYLIRVRFMSNVSSYYLRDFINSNFCRRTQIEPHVVQQNGQANFNGSKLKSICLPLPPFEEQKAIVEKVESLMEKCRALEEEISQSEQHAQMLMQAVLKEAFEG
jgi:type I restriction enzyme, S subunit